MKKNTQTARVGQQELALENSQLINLQIAANMKAQQFHTACDKIEHARRNIEVVSRAMAIDAIDKPTKDKMDEVIILNLEILKETSKL